MVCYARPASRLAVIVLIAWLAFAMPVRHYFDHAALVMAVTVATAGAVVAAALAFVIFMSVRRRRAAAGGCVSCQFRCQHAMTEPPRRLWLVTTTDRRPPGPAVGRLTAAPGHPSAPGHPGTAPGRSASILLPMPAARSAAPAPAAADAENRGLAAPRWPDRPALRASQVTRSFRAGSGLMPVGAGAGDTDGQRRLDRRPFGRDHREHGRVPQHSFLAGGP
jgi:hypothetical protein